MKRSAIEAAVWITDGFEQGRPGHAHVFASVRYSNGDYDCEYECDPVPLPLDEYGELDPDMAEEAFSSEILTARTKVEEALGRPLPWEKQDTSSLPDVSEWAAWKADARPPRAFSAVVVEHPVGDDWFAVLADAAQRLGYRIDRELRP